MSDESEKRLREGLASGEFELTPPEEVERLRNKAESYRAPDTIGPLTEGLDPFDPQADILGRREFDAHADRLRRSEPHQDLTPCARDECQPDGYQWVYYWYGNQCYTIRKYERCE